MLVAEVGIKTAKERIGRGCRHPLQRGMGALPLLAIFALLCVGCGEDAEPDRTSPKRSDELVTGSFVGELQGTDAYVAVVADEPQQGADVRQVRIYVCSAQSPISEWFTATSPTNEISLTSLNTLGQAPGQIKTTLTPESATGTVTLADGRTYNFSAKPVTGVAGFFQARVSPDGRLSATSKEGLRMEGNVAGQLPDGRYLIKGTITPPQGAPHPFEVTNRSGPDATARVIVLPDGRVQGRGVKGSDTTTQFQDPYPFI